MSMLITLYVICTVIILLVQYTARLREYPHHISGSKYRYSAGLVIVLFLVITFISAFRYGFIDTGVYREICRGMGTDYGRLNDDDLEFKDYGFNFLMVFLNRMGFGPQSIIVVCAIISFAVFLFILYKYSLDLPFSLFLLLFLSYYTMINGIRQILAVSIILMAFPFLVRRKFLLFVPFVLVAYTIHSSAIILLPLYFVLTRKRLNIGVFIFLGVIALFFVAPSLADSLLGSLLKDSVYSEYLQIDLQMGVTRLAVATVPLILSGLYCNSTSNRPRPEYGTPEYLQQQFVDSLINMQFVSFGFTVLGLRMVYFARMSIYFEIVNALLIPITIEQGFNRYSSRIIKHATIVLYFAYFLYQTYTYMNYGHFNDFHLIF